MATVLVVDDCPNICHVLREVLEMEGYRVFTAYHGGPALIRMRNSRQRLVVLLGLMMPYVNGLEVLRAVAADPVLAKRHRIIMVTGQTGWAMSDPVATLREQLGVPLIAKPFTVDDIWDGVAQAAQQLHNP